ncbi:PREDICTED: leucine-rich repeat-containing protein 16A-like [Priapulus caudatus]|uniref:Leucine-rich repeat-containing protein 16A-like n=1 Tax=Priapulus caudatus TaxID=37621 RepID=A0ABM1EXS7_PRICU|nr:PREDICTED: leucine-rich repeat-containing protein 16A-like [Priapulus caudatus]
MAPLCNITKNIRDSVKNAVGHHVPLSFTRMMRIDAKGKGCFEMKILVLAKHRLYILGQKAPTKIEHSVHYLEVQGMESKTPSLLTLQVPGKKMSFLSLEKITDEMDMVIKRICCSIHEIFPHQSLGKLVGTATLLPHERRTSLDESLRQVEVAAEVGACGGFTAMYGCLADMYGLPFREEVAWDVDTIYMSHNSRELCLQDFDHLDIRDLIPVVAVLEYSTWFISLSSKDMKLSQDVQQHIVRVVEASTSLEELSLVAAGLKCTFISTFVLEVVTAKVERCHTTVGTEQGCGQLLHKIPVLTSFLVQASSLSHLNISSMDCPLETVFATLMQSCCPTLSSIDLSMNPFQSRSSRDKLAVVLSCVKDFFASCHSLRDVKLAGCRLPTDVIKCVLLGIACNKKLHGVSLDLSANEMRKDGAYLLDVVLPGITNIVSLDISDNGFDNESSVVCTALSRNKSIRHVAMGKNFNSIKPRNLLPQILEYVVQTIQTENSIESISLADSKLKVDTCVIINALGSNNTLSHIDLSGNLMGHSGAKMLAKALQINTKLTSLAWDRNNTNAQDFIEVAHAMEKNYTLQFMHLPLVDMASAAKENLEKTEKALKKIEEYMFRNRAPQKMSSDQLFRLQQGILLGSTQHMVDMLVMKIREDQEMLKKSPHESIRHDLEAADRLADDAARCKQLLPNLYHVAVSGDTSGSSIERKLQEIANDLTKVVEKHMEENLRSMIACAEQLCPNSVTGQELFQESLSKIYSPEMFPQAKDLVNTAILLQAAPPILNKISEMTLSLAAQISDKVMDEVLESLSKMHKNLTNPLSAKRKSVYSRMVRPQSSYVGDSFDDCDRSVDDVVVSDGHTPRAVANGLLSPSPPETDEATDTLPELAEQPRLDHLGKSRPRRLKKHSSSQVLVAAPPVDGHAPADDFFGAHIPMSPDGVATLVTSSAVPPMSPPPVSPRNKEDEKEGLKKSKDKSQSPVTPATKPSKDKKERTSFMSSMFGKLTSRNSVATDADAEEDARTASVVEAPAVDHQVPLYSVIDRNLSPPPVPDRKLLQDDAESPADSISGAPSPAAAGGSSGALSPAAGGIGGAPSAAPAGVRRSPNAGGPPIGAGLLAEMRVAQEKRRSHAAPPPAPPARPPSDARRPPPPPVKLSSSGSPKLLSATRFEPDGDKRTAAQAEEDGGSTDFRSLLKPAATAGKMAARTSGAAEAGDVADAPTPEPMVAPPANGSAATKPAAPPANGSAAAARLSAPPGNRSAAAKPAAKKPVAPALKAKTRGSTGGGEVPRSTSKIDETVRHFFEG